MWGSCRPVSRCQQSLGCCRRSDYWKAKYELLHVVRTHMGASDDNYNCVFQRPDADGKVGVHLSKQLMAIAGHALKANITTLGPLVLPISEQLLFFFNLIARKVRSKSRQRTAHPVYDIHRQGMGKGPTGFAWPGAHHSKSRGSLRSPPPPPLLPPLFEFWSPCTPQSHVLANFRGPQGGSWEKASWLLMQALQTLHADLHTLKIAAR